MTVYALKPRFQSFLRPAVAALAAWGVTANQVTVAAALGSVVLGAVLVADAGRGWLFALLPAWLVLRMALNAIDGVLAREHGQTSALGAFLNEIGDVVSDAAMIVPFAFVAPFEPLWVGAVALLAALSELAGVLGLSVGASRRYDGPMGKSDRAVVFGALGLAVALVATLPHWLAWVLPAVALALVVTITNRIRAALGEAAG